MASILGRAGAFIFETVMSFLHSLFRLGLIFGVGVCFGAPHKIDLNLETLELKNGESLRAVVLRSYDPANGRVIVAVERQISSIQLELFPDELAGRIRAMVPSEEKDLERQLREERKRIQREDARRNAATNAAGDRTTPSRTKAEERRAEQAKARILSQVKSVAASRATRYFRYEQKSGSGHTVTVRRDVELEEPEEVAGWENRYRVKGTIGLEYYDSYGRSFNTTSRTFEMLVQVDQRGNAKVVDFTAH